MVILSRLIDGMRTSTGSMNYIIAIWSSAFQSEKREIKKDVVGI